MSDKHPFAVNPTRLQVLLEKIPAECPVGTVEDLHNYLHNPFYLNEFHRLVTALDDLSGRMYLSTDPTETMRLKAKIEGLLFALDFPAQVLVSDKATPIEQREELLEFIKEKFYARARA